MPSRPNRPGARWCKPSEDRASDLVEEFQNNLRRITKRLAYHDQCDTIDAKHVNDAFDALSRQGLRRNRWWNSPELKTTCGTAAIALAFAVPDFLPYANLNETVQRYAGISIMAVLVLIGGFLHFFAWCQGRL